MDIEAKIEEAESKESIKINKVNYYLSTGADEDASATFCLSLHDPHDLMAALDERKNQD